MFTKLQKAIAAISSERGSVAPGWIASTSAASAQETREPVASSLPQPAETRPHSGEPASRSEAVVADWEADLRPKRRGWKYWTMVGAGITAALAGVIWEVRTSWLQSKIFTAVLDGASYEVTPGAASNTYTTGQGPYDERLGYTRLNDILGRLQQNGFVVEAQAKWSPRLQSIGRFGVYPLYQEKARGGMRLLDRNGLPLHASVFPAESFDRFSDIAPLIVKAALFIENREILDSWAQNRNPAIEWDRLAKAVLDYGIKQVNSSHSISGGSTLATQLEKVRHSPSGRTEGPVEKVRQMTTASLRAYMEGPSTLETRRRIVRDYINSLPLAATPGTGEVIGLADGLSAWYGADPKRVNDLLLAGPASLSPEDEAAQGAAFRQVLGLLLAINRPTYYLRQQPQALYERAESYLRVMAAEGLISDRLRDRALAAQVKLRPAGDAAGKPMELSQKGTDSVRTSLLSLLGVSSLYELDRMDLTVETTLHQDASRRAAATMEKLNDPEFAAQSGLVGEKLLSTGQGESVIYSLTLFERGEKNNRLLVQLDSARQALNLNEGSKLELGSTAKLRTMVTYLETVAALHRDLVENKQPLPDDPDRLTQWAAEYREKAGTPSLAAMLEAAMLREYSASPGEAFWTGGGIHAFRNFDSADNERRLTVREAFRRSVNLVFIRMMRDIVNYHMRRLPSYSPGLFADERHPQRQKLLARFADREGSVFLRSFYTKYTGLSGDEVMEKLFEERDLSASRFAVMHRSVKPDASFGEFQLAMLAHVNENISEKRQQELYDMYGPGKFTWQDRGYVAGIHPLELWMANYLQTTPEPGWEQVRDASRYIRQEVYRWLFTSKSKHGQDLRIRSVLEVDAFEPIYQSWKRQGFPFRYMVPSLASAIGSSGDTPAALADLAGIILNDGVRLPNVRVERLRFAEGTPFEAHLARKKEEPQQAIPVEIARQLHKDMTGVVQFGTARRAFQSVKDSEGNVLEVGGKTGTGDNRSKSLWKVGKTRNRTAAFVFTIGKRYFGTVVAYVPGEQAASYRFSSALPVTVFKLIVPQVVASVEESDRQAMARRAGKQLAIVAAPQVESIAR